MKNKLLLYGLLSMAFVLNSGKLPAQENMPFSGSTSSAAGTPSEYSQQENQGESEPQSETFTADKYFIKLDNSILSVQDSAAQMVYTQKFSHPTGYVADLDGDGTVEFLINDFREHDGTNSYSLYVFNTVDTFYLADSIYSGLKEPYYVFSPEIKSVVLITGSPDVDSLYNGQIENIFSPMVCWAVVDGELTIVNDQLYDIFMEENDKIISFIETYFKANAKDCTTSKQLISAIATLTINYYYAEEKTNAENVLKQFYFCDDREKLAEVLLKML